MSRKTMRTTSKANRRRNAAVPVQYRDLLLGDIVPRNDDQVEALDVIDAWMNKIKSHVTRYDFDTGELVRQGDGRGLLLSGQAGVGKTMMGSAIANEVLERRAETWFVRMSEFVRMIGGQITLESAWKQGDDSAYFEWCDRDAWLEKARYYLPVVVIDDCGHEHITESRWSATVVEDFLRDRYQRGLPTVLLTNILSLHAWETEYSASLASFIQEAFVFVPISGDDLRAEVSLDA